MKIKIDDELFNIKDLQTQLNIDNESSTHIYFDLEKYNYKDKLFELYDNKKIFEIVTNSFESKLSFIKTIDYGNKFLCITIKSKDIKIFDSNEIRDRKINELFKD
jgi:hypothetical protein